MNEIHVELREIEQIQCKRDSETEGERGRGRGAVAVAMGVRVQRVLLLF